MQDLIPTFVKRNDGTIDYHPLVDFKRTFDFNPNPPADVINLAALGNSRQQPMTARHDGHLILTKVMCERTGPMTIRIYDPARKIFFMNNPVHIDTIVGNGGLPSMLPETLFLEATRSLQVEFVDISGLPNTVRFALGGMKLYHLQAPKDAMDDFLGKKHLLTFPFFLTPDNGVFTIPAGGQITQFAHISSDFDFEMFKINSVSDEDYTVEFRFRGDSWSNNAQIHNNIATGTAQFPRVIEKTLIRRNEVVEMRFTNLSAINPNIVYFTMLGRGIVRV